MVNVDSKTLQFVLEPRCNEFSLRQRYFYVDHTAIQHQHSVLH